VNIAQAFEESFRELGLDLDGTSDDTLLETDESDEETEAQGGPESDESVDAPAETEDASDEDDDVRSDAPTVEVPKGAVLRLPDGTTVEADKAVLLQSDYTRKTQQVAEERKRLESERNEFDTQREQITQAYEQMRGWYEERVSNPSDWVKEIISESQDPTTTIARALYELANDGKLDPQFVATFGIDAGEVAERAKVSARDRELEDLRKKVEARERTEQEQARIREQAARYQSQWDEIKQSTGLSFDNADAEREAKRELLEFAVKSQLAHSLVDAYDLMRARQAKAVKEQPAPDPAILAKKRASRAVTPRSDSVGPGRPKGNKPKSTREAALEALSEFATGA
jgi:uncharacterized protein YgiM (DUF1202 family)